MSYCCMIYGNAPKYLTACMSVIQKIVIKTILHGPRCTALIVVYDEARTLPFQDIYVTHILLFMFRYVYNHLPDIFAEFFYAQRTNYNETNQICCLLSASFWIKFFYYLCSQCRPKTIE